ncbi:MAG TPA: type II toxin-antitoxin system ParD family antitoxin [Planctomycetota bacterium]|nr:type II toxin-antitoxin system ParD family antitoxin [Planctomycetota bacterium]
MKATTMNISLPAELARYVREKVEGGQYSSASEVVREALRRLSSDELREQSFRTLSGTRCDPERAAAAVDDLLALQKRHDLGGAATVEDLIREGRDE